MLERLDLEQLIENSKGALAEVEQRLREKHPSFDRLMEILDAARRMPGFEDSYYGRIFTPGAMDLIMRITGVVDLGKEKNKDNFDLF